jgi:molecular chaperone IbpA|tara:strand:+ start:228 stop:710 length:483 start_codon:yes stop_codon:yes gene_type:complete
MVTNNAAALRRFDPFFVGFDRLWREIDRLDRTDAFAKPQSYPPYNIRKHEDDETYSIELAVAGFKEQDINVVLEDSKLTVQGEIKETDGGNLLHKGIALRAFTRQFTLSDTIKVEGAELKDGLLVIQLKEIIPDHKKPRQIPVTSGGKIPEAKKELLTEE